MEKADTRGSAKLCLWDQKVLDRPAQPMKYSFRPFHSYLAKRAREEITRIKAAIPQSKIEHIGSTSIPGVGGKGIIDLYISVSKKDLDRASLIIQKLSYEFKPTGGVPNKRLFHQRIMTYKDGHKQMFHAHLTYSGNKDWINSIAFRDFLRSNPKLANEYSEIKHKAVAAAKKFRKKSDKKKAYMNAKKPVIEKIMRLVKS